MAPPSISLLEDLNAKEIEKLTQLLVLSPKTAPHTIWLQHQAECMSTLPPALKRSHSLLPRLAISIPFGTQKAQLCTAHKPLNSYLIRRIFLQVSAECTTRLSRLVGNPYLPADIAIHVKTLQTANSLWMSPDLYRVTFQCQPEEERFERIDSDCDACILAAVGGNIRILQELRTSMLGRKRKRGKTARLLPLVEAWIDWTGAGDSIRERSEVLAREVRNCRRQMQEARRQKRRNLTEGIVDSSPPPPPAQDDDMKSSLLNHDAVAQAFVFKFQDYDEGIDDHEQAHDPEGSIIDFYANRLSTAKGTLDKPQDETSMHPAFRKSLVFQLPDPPSPNSSSSPARESLPPRPGNPTAYTDSEPSLKSGYRGASAAVTPTPALTSRVHQHPPLAYNNRKNQKHKSKKRNTGYTESVYSTGNSTVNLKGYAPSSLAPSMPPNSSFAEQTSRDQQKPRRVRSTEEQAGEYRGLLDVDEDQDQDPRRDEWEDRDEYEGRNSRVTSFGDFI
ncbi:hypothetical protein VTL71DRAFT_1034 [Oculimacula yallundae]|uniref:Uncharacterized protein n=1 Tax=Oculimacula yallundae TaxID=86028 RepID=A0ABR4D1Q7_9HELO